MDADVIVVGAGPAGTTAAKLCVAAGLDTLIVDRAVFPREKPCAGALSPRAVIVLARVFGPRDFGVPRTSLRAHFFLDGPRGGAPSRPARPDRSASRWHGYRRLVVEAGRPLFYVTGRAVLDQSLLDRARADGARVLTGTEVVTWGQDPDGVWATVRGATPPLGLRPSLGRALTARYLVGADGAASVVARGLHASRRQGGPVARTLSLRVPLTPEDASETTGGRVDFHFGLLQGGYGWAFPGPSGLAVGVGALARGGRRARGGGGPGDASLRGALTKLLAVYGLPYPPPGADPPTGWLVPLGGRRRPWVEGRVLLAGDAAGVADPLTGEGIGPAVASGEIAARVIVALAGLEGLGSGKPGPTRRRARPHPLAGRAGERLAAAMGLGGRGETSPGAYERSLWEEVVSAQRPRLVMARAASALSPGGQGLLFRRSTFSRMMGLVGGDQEE